MRGFSKAAALLGAMALSISAASAQTLIPGGFTVGVAVSTRGAVVAGASDVAGAPSPARLAGLRPGDVITEIDGFPVESAADLARELSGDPCTLTYQRNGEIRRVHVTPAFDRQTGGYKLGVLVRDSAAGIGTLTYYDPESGGYGALGHAITDGDAGVVLPIRGGGIYENALLGVEKGQSGRPGELTGQFVRESALGSIEENSAYGIFGQAAVEMENSLYPQGLEAAGRDKMRTGSAGILCDVGQGIREYACEIVRLEKQNSPAMRSFTIRVTDEALLKITGGIVQGMSGSPVVQDGFLVGAVTHVYVDDPAMGYGVYLDWMLETARQAQAA